MSWEGHLWGAVAGFAMAFYLRKKGPQRQLYQWEKDEILEKQREELMETIVFEQIDPLQLPAGNKESPQQKLGDSSNSVNIKYEYRPASSRKGKRSED
jgi:hypothetical protein